VHWSLVFLSANLRLRTPHLKRSPRQPDEHDPRLSVPVFGVVLDVLSQAFEVPPEGVPGLNLLPARPDHGHGEDDEGEARQEGLPCGLSWSSA